MHNNTAESIMIHQTGRQPRRQNMSPLFQAHLGFLVL
jgi:hypothetical protein